MIVGPADDGDVPAVDERKLDTRYSRRYRGTTDTRRLKTILTYRGSDDANRLENTVRNGLCPSSKSGNNRAVSQHGVRLLSIDDDEE